MRRALLSFAALVVLATTASCLSPTLPLPPPEHPDSVGQDMNGLWQISGTCDKGATVYVLNTATGLGAIFEDLKLHGTYHVAIGGNACDTIWVSQWTLDSGESPPNAFVLEAWSSGGPTDPTSCQ